MNGGSLWQPFSRDRLRISPVVVTALQLTRSASKLVRKKVVIAAKLLRPKIDSRRIFAPWGAEIAARAHLYSTYSFGPEPPSKVTDGRIARVTPFSDLLTRGVCPTPSVRTNFSR